MPSFAGLISSVLGGAAAGYGESAQTEMKKQADLDLRKQMLDAETEKASRLDEINRNRNRDYARAETAYNQNPETIAAAANAEAAKFDALIKAGVPEAKARSLVAEGVAAAGAREKLAPVTAGADIAEGASRLGTQIALAPAQAAAARAQFDAEKELRGLKLNEVTADQIAKAKALVADKGYMDALEKTDLAAHAHLIKIANIRATSLEDISADRLEAARFKAANRGPGSTVPTTADLQRQITAAENSLANKLGVKKTDLNEELARLQKRTDPASKAKFDGLAAERATLDAARKQLLDWSKIPKEAAAAPAAPASNARPPLSAFGSK